MFDAFKRSGKPGGNDWPRLVVISTISLRAYNANYDDDDDDDDDDRYKYLNALLS